MPTSPDKKEVLMHRRKAYFINPVVKTERGAFIPCFAIEDESGYYETKWEWDTTLKKAQKLAQRINDRLGITAEDAERIVLSSMKPLTLH
jgi:hypothetical protein